jgi:Fe-S cluster biosynthesis and repair protein YggX
VNRFASQTRRVKCVKYGRELPGPEGAGPIRGRWASACFEEVSALAWDEWVEHSKMIINEYRINAADPNSVRVLMEQCEQFFYGGGVRARKANVPE